MNTPKAAATHDSEGTPANSQASAPAAAPIECWQCATQQGPFVQGVHLLCNDCDAGERREYAEQERDE